MPVEGKATGASLTALPGHYATDQVNLRTSAVACVRFVCTISHRSRNERINWSLNGFIR
jgi:hypothetical protein